MTLYIHDGLNVIKFVFAHVLCPFIFRVINFRLLRTVYKWNINQNITLYLLKLNFTPVYKQEKGINFIIVLTCGIQIK